MKKLIIQIVLAALIIFLGYKCYESIMVPQRFKAIKEQRYDRIYSVSKTFVRHRMLTGVYTTATPPASIP